jgi:hypothetical protein
MVVINGTSLMTVSESYSFSVSVSHQNPKREEVRQYDTVRVYQKGGGGSSGRAGDDINRSNFIDVEVLKKVRLAGDDAGPWKMIYGGQPDAENIEILETDMTRRNT